MNSSHVVGGITITSPGALTADVNAFGSSNSELNVTAANIAIANALKFANSKSIRTSTTVLAAFNAFAAFITAAGIIRSCWNKRRRQRRPSETPPSGLFFIHTIDVLPFVLSVAITFQSITFAAAQSIGLQSLLSSGCALVGTFMLPFVFIVPLIQVVFGVETAIRGVRSNFVPRGRWSVGVCLGAVGFISLVFLIVASVDQAPDHCFASLTWFVRHYAVMCFVVLTLLSIILLVVIGTIFLKLRNSVSMSTTERTAATRMIYYLVLGFISELFILPFFFFLTFYDPQKILGQTLNLGMVAAVVLNVNGLLVACLYMFHRSKSNSACYDREENEFKEDLFHRRDRKDQNRGSYLSLQHIKGSNDRPRSEIHQTLLYANNADNGQDFMSPMSSGTSRSNFSPKISIPFNPAYPEPTQPPSETSPSQIRKQSYSLYSQDSTAAAAVLPATTYSPMTSTLSRDSWVMPPAVKPWLSAGHRRNSSSASTATVQIGIRFSNVKDYVPRKSCDTDVIIVPDVPEARTTPAWRPSPLAAVESRPASSTYETTDFIIVEPPLLSPARDAKKDTRPPSGPKSPAISVMTTYEAAPPAGSEDSVSPVSDNGEDSEPEGSLITLSPAVYQDPFGPQRSASTRSDRSNKSNGSLRKLPSPMGVGFNTPGGRSDLRTVASATKQPSGSTSAPKKKADWI